MATSSEPVKLNNHHRDTLLRIFQHPASHNIEWRDVESLIGAVGSIEEHRDGKYRVVIGSDVQFLERPKHKDIDLQQVVDLRRMLSAAGYAQLVEEIDREGTSNE